MAVYLCIVKEGVRAIICHFYQRRARRHRRRWGRLPLLNALGLDGLFVTARRRRWGLDHVQASSGLQTIGWVRRPSARALGPPALSPSHLSSHSPLCSLSHTLSLAGGTCVCVEFPRRHCSPSRSLSHRTRRSCQPSSRNALPAAPAIQTLGMGAHWAGTKCRRCPGSSAQGQSSIAVASPARTARHVHNLVLSSEVRTASRSWTRRMARQGKDLQEEILRPRGWPPHRGIKA